MSFREMLKVSSAVGWRVQRGKRGQEREVGMTEEERREGWEVRIA